jgi:esterase/lipase superfamily enzyme
MNTTVFFATNRRLLGLGDKLTDYAGEAGPAGMPGKLTHAMAFVEGTDIPSQETGRVRSIEGISPYAFSTKIAADLTGGRDLLIFIHGFANSFSDALTRAAFNRVWFAKGGADCTVVAFSWPSAGVVLDPALLLPGLLLAPINLLLDKLAASPLASAYLADQKAADASAADLTSFLDRMRPIAKQMRARGRRVFLLCHSMGNRVMESTLANWARMGLPVEILFDEAISVSADTAFQDKDGTGNGHDWLRHLGKISKGISVYFSRADIILKLSQRVNQIQRLGADGPADMALPGRYPISRFRFVDCSALKDLEPNGGIDKSHQFYRRLPRVRDDIGKVLQGIAEAGHLKLT